MLLYLLERLQVCGTSREANEWIEDLEDAALELMFGGETCCAVYICSLLQNCLSSFVLKPYLKL